MESFGWTRREKFKVAIPVIVAALFALQNIGCGSTGYVVLNQSQETVQFASSTKACGDLNPGDLSSSYWISVSPESESSVATVGTSQCFVAQISGSEFVKVEFLKEATYQFDVANGALTVDIIPGEPTGPSRFAVISVAAGVVFLGVLIAGVVILRRD